MEPQVQNTQGIEKLEKSLMLLAACATILSGLIAIRQSVGPPQGAITGQQSTVQPCVIERN
jgi:hypothetical protein